MQPYMEEIATVSKQYRYEKPGSSTGKKISVIAALLVLIGALIFVGITLFSSKEEKLTAAGIVPSPTEVIIPTVTPEITPTKAIEQKVTSSPKLTLTLTPKPSGKVAGASSLDRSLLTIEIQNGSGTVGLAAKAAEKIRELGYTVKGTGNADSFDYEKTVIQVKPSQSTYLSLLKKDLASLYVIGSASATLSASSSTDAVIILGQQ